MRFPAVVLATLLLSACGPKQISLVDVGPKPAEPLAESEGAVLVEVIHAIGPGGPHIDRWTRVGVTSTLEVDPNREPEIFTLEKVAELSGDSAVFAGVLPGGFYRLHALEGERQVGDSLYPYTVAVPEGSGDFFVSGGKLNSLGVMLQTTIGQWTWLYEREPSFDLPALVKRLRPDLVALDAPLLIPEELAAKKKEPDSGIKRAWPVTPPVLHGADALLFGAQFGRVYHRVPAGAPGVSGGDWRVHSLDSLQPVIDVVSAGANRAFALLANGDIRVLDLETGATAARVTPPPEGRAVKLGFVDGVLHAATEMPAGEGRVLRVYRHADADGWAPLGEALSLARQPNSLLFVEDALLATVGGTPHGATATLLRVSLADGSVERLPTSVQLVRELAPGLLVGARLPARAPRSLAFSRNGGRSWSAVRELEPFGWPTLDDQGRLLIPAVISDNGTNVISILARSGRFENVPAGEWTRVARFPARCMHFMQTAFRGGKLVVTCGERVFQLEGNGAGWSKEALHELQSSLP